MGGGGGGGKREGWMKMFLFCFGLIFDFLLVKSNKLKYYETDIPHPAPTEQ